ncbi:MAG: hypothetical protein ABII00_08370 [Elusimicrobiota bacterium]
MRGRNEAGLQRAVLTAAVVLVLLIAYHGVRKAARRWAAPRPPATRTVERPRDAGRTETPPTYIPPIRVIREAGARRKAPEEAPPPVPMPPIAPDRAAP